MGAVEAQVRLTGGCQCGAVRYALTAQPRGAGICHCRMCQKAGGAPFMAFTGVRQAHFSFTRGAPALYRSSEIAERGFCAVCGTPLTYRLLGHDGINVTIGSLDRPADVAPSEQFGVESVLPWFARLAALPASRTEDWMKALNIAGAGSRQHPDTDCGPSRRPERQTNAMNRGRAPQGDNRMSEAYIFDHVRTPRGRGKPDGSLHTASTLHLAATALKAIKDRNHLEPTQVDDVVMGCVDPVGEAGGDIARMGALAAGFGDTVPGVQINRFCASGLDSVNFAAAQVMSGQHDLTIGGGVESMSRVGIGASGGAWPADPSLAVPAYFMPQGVSADLIATKYGFSRDDVDAYAVQSQKRAAAAWKDGRFKGSIAPVKDVNGLSLLDHDEHMRPQTDMQSLASLKPAFVIPGEQGGFNAVAIQAHPEVERIIHVHHAGNSSGIVDGAAAVLLGSREAGEKAGLKPRGKIRAFANIGSEPAIMLTGPVDVTKKVLARSGMSIGDIDLFEVNEAFAAVVLRFIQAFDVDPNKVNVNGGAIALGHPLGATGAMILGTALDELERTGKSTALITLCIGGGMGTATIIERV